MRDNVEDRNDRKDYPEEVYVPIRWPAIVSTLLELLSAATTHLIMCADR
jgi:hypothetical protein